MPATPTIKGTFRTDRRARAAYAEGAGVYRIIPRAVCLPANHDDVVALVRWAAEHEIPLVPRGAGSAMSGANVGAGVVVDLTAATGQRLEVDPRARRARMPAGAPLGELAQEAARHTLRLPPDPSSQTWATAGGVIGTNAAGARSVRYGSVRRWAQSVEMVTSEGKMLRLGRGEPGRWGDLSLASLYSRLRPPAATLARWPKLRKNSFGYALDEFAASGDALDLVIGAEGTLGIVTAVEWRLDVVPRCRAGVRVLLGDYAELPALVADLRALEVSAIELLDRTFLDVVRSAEPNLPLPHTEAVLLVEIEAESEAALRRAADAAVRAARPRAVAVDAALSGAGTEQLWRIRHAASPILARLPPERRSLQVIEDGCVPVERLGEYVAALRQAAADCDIPVVLFGHAGDGNVHANALADTTRRGWQKRLRELYARATDAVIALGGVPSGEHGAGRLRAGLLQRAYGEEIVSLFHEVKRSFDPLGIFNPGVILPSGEPPLSRLKVGAAAARLPPDVERALREIERTGGYATLRLTLADG
ncbi:MAG TPA: FAD-binding oxidoreductase [Gemmatimonadales bacterium]|nr:FAD-binding oxidoreductase [Gemmatimonadales bacterium]